MPDSTINYHEDVQLFRDAVRFTAAQTGFNERLIEKDYYCTLALADLTEGKSEVVFKGGTCLSKIHADFSRLSENLDFCVSTNIDASRSLRRARQQHMHVIRGHRTLQDFDVIRSANLSHQIPKPLANFPDQYPLAVLRHPHEVVLDVVTAMGARPVVFHL